MIYRFSQCGEHLCQVSLISFKRLKSDRADTNMITDERTDRQTYRQTDGWTGRPVGRRADGRTPDHNIINSLTAYSYLLALNSLLIFNTTITSIRRPVSIQGDCRYGEVRTYL